MTATVQRDERTTAVENAGYRLAYLVLSFGALLIVAYRSFALRQSSWDLLALVILGGVVHTGYQVKHKVVYAKWVKMAVITFVVAALLAIIMTQATAAGSAFMAGMRAAQSAR